MSLLFECTITVQSQAFGPTLDSLTEQVIGHTLHTLINRQSNIDHESFRIHNMLDLLFRMTIIRGSRGFFDLFLNARERIDHNKITRGQIR